MDQERAARAGVAAAVLGAVLAVVGFWLAWGPGDRSLSGLVHDNTMNNAGNGVWICALAIVLLRSRPGNRLGWVVLWLGLANSLTMLGAGWALASYLVARAGQLGLSTVTFRDHVWKADDSHGWRHGSGGEGGVVVA